MIETVSYDRQSATWDDGNGKALDSAPSEPLYKRLTFARAAVLYAAAGGEVQYLPPLVRLIGDWSVNQITQTKIDYAAAVLCGDLSPATANRQVYTPVSAVLKFCALRGWCEYRRIKRPSAAKRSSPLPSTEEVDRFVNAAGPSLRRILIFLISTGRTVRETLRLDWQQVNLTRGTAQLRNPRGQTTTVVLPPRVVEMMAHFMHRAGKVFRRPDGGPYSEILSAGGQLKKAVEGAQRRSGIKITPRMLRHIWRSRNGDD